MVREKDINQYGLFRAQRFLILFIVSFCFFVAAKPAYAQASFLSASEQVLISELMSANESLLADGRQGIDFKKNILNGSSLQFTAGLSRLPKRSHRPSISALSNLIRPRATKTKSTSP